MNVFGKVHLGYLCIETTRFGDWRRFGADGVGLHVDELDRDRMRFRLDDHECRLLLQRGPAEDVTTVGWHVDDHEAFDDIVGRITARGVTVEQGHDEEAALRGVRRLVRFPGPKGLVQELYTTPVTTTAPLHMQASGFVTGDAGMGHIAISSRQPDAIHRYYDNLLDARLSDFIVETISRVRFRIRFLRVNGRHHSVAVANTEGLRIDPIRTAIQHLNTQVATLDDMTISYQRLKQLGFTMALGIGQHTNDKELSYYVRTPSGFEWEVGWNPIVVDEGTWEPTTHQGISIWGHTPEGQSVIDKLNQFRRGAASLRRAEITVPALSGATA
ncbi:2,3-dihydroxybiphenyl 1,2-dioxygenase [Micromonospora kangleipakensis]|uniref:2,3-dihydroxybiphenyl 1,2-dioxygenase n=1 Tax=Micromonospora kangleipakensis TaxID=1077942 RepID=A0A4Q8B9I3_9ACTN|nr:VOC family protein [Micromonospora kangleipakensis]RZU74402.1 2,3-dihydroxybiphenyl 1,2-dioxygenase [Micromonospora kangleipakensis]